VIELLPYHVVGDDLVSGTSVKDQPTSRPSLGSEGDVFSMWSSTAWMSTFVNQKSGERRPGTLSSSQQILPATLAFVPADREAWWRCHWMSVRRKNARWSGLWRIHVPSLGKGVGMSLRRAEACDAGHLKTAGAVGATGWGVQFGAGDFKRTAHKKCAGAEKICQVVSIAEGNHNIAALAGGWGEPKAKIPHLNDNGSLPLTSCHWGGSGKYTWDMGGEILQPCGKVPFLQKRHW